MERAEREYAKSILSTAPSEKKEINRYTAVYNFSLGDTVYLEEAFMTFFPMMIIWLSYMTMISLINKQIVRSEFDRLLRDTPRNDGLIVPMQEEPYAATPPAEQQDTENTPSSELAEGVKIIIDDRQYIVESIRDNSVSLQDVTFENATGFPIFRSESLDYVRGIWEESVLRQNIINALNDNGFAVSDELVKDGIAEYRSRAARAIMRKLRILLSGHI